MGIQARKPPERSANGHRTPSGITARKPPPKEMPEEPEYLGTCDHFPTHSVIIEKRRARELTQFDCCSDCADTLLESLKPDMSNSWTITVRILTIQQLTIFDALETYDE